MTIEAIKLAIFKRLRGSKHDAWDEQMNRDFSPGGRGMRLLAQVQQQIAEGHSNPMRLSAKPPGQNE